MRTILLLLIYILLTILLIPVLCVCLLIRQREPLISIGKAALALGKRLLGIHTEISGLERIERKERYVFMANHLSFIDGPLLFFIIPQKIRVILKKEVFRIPIIGLGMKFVGFVPVDRRSLRGGKKSIERASSFIKKKGYSYLIFPEGTRSRDGKLQPFRRGGFLLAVESGVSIVPVSISGSYEIMPRGSFFIKRGKVRITFHQPVSVEGFCRSNLSLLLDRVRNVIQSSLEGE